MFEKGKIAPDLNLVDEKGGAYHLWDFRNRSHVALVVPPDYGTLSHHLLESTAHKKTWDWLGLKIFGIDSKNFGDVLQPGAYAIDRYGAYIGHLPWSDQIWVDIEKEFVIYDAKHC